MILQGDSYTLPFQLSDGDTVITQSMVQKVEIVIGPFRKVYPGEIIYDNDTKAFAFPVSQEESLTISGKFPAQIRCLLHNGEVVGSELPDITIQKGLSSEVLQ